MKTFLGFFAICIFTSIHCFGQGTAPPSTIRCLRKVDGDPCPEPPPDCGTIWCPRPSVTNYATKSGNPCVLFPSYDWSDACPGNSKEPVGLYTGRLADVDYGSPPGDGYDEVEQRTKICWKWRYCSASCTQTAALDTGSDPTKQVVDPIPPGCPREFTVNLIPRKRAKCDAGSGTGDVELGSETAEEFYPKGVKKICKEEEAK